MRINVGRSKIEGFEASVGINIVDADRHTLRLDLAGTFLRSEILEFAGTPLQVAQNLGNDLPAAPKFSGNASLAYTFRPNADWRFGTTLDLRNKSSEFKRLNNAFSTKNPAFTVVNLRAEITNETTGLGVYAFARNLFDDVYFVDISAGGRLVAPPRTFGAGFRYNF